MKIVIAEPIGLSPNAKEKYIAQLSEIGHKVVFYDSRPSSQDDLADRVKDAEILIISTYPVEAEAMKNMPRLKLLSVAFTGYNHVDIDYCRNNYISVSNAAGYSTVSVAEQTIMMILSLLRNTSAMESSCRNLSDRHGFLGGELAGRTVGIVGYGSIGSYTAKLFDALGSNVIVAARKSLPPVIGFVTLPLEKMLKEADVVSLHVPLNQENKHLIGEKELSMMKPSSLLINTSRGGVVDNEALAKALINKTIAGAAIDVFDMEPPLPKDYPLLNAPNTLLLPHTAFATAEAMERRADLILDGVIDWLNGKGGTVVA